MEPPVQQKKGRFSRWMGEGVLVIAVLLLGFLLLAVWIQTQFPETGFLEFWFSSESSESSKSSEPDSSQPEQTSLPVATLSVVTNEVRSRRADDIVWSSAEAGRDLFERDAVQTMKNAHAVVRFDAHQKITLSENSLVIIKGLRTDEQMKTSFIEVVGGSFRSQIGGGESEEKVKLHVSTPTAVTEVTGGKDEVADFQIEVNPDKTSHVTVFKGVAKVNASGVTVEVKENEGTSVGLSGPPLAPRALLHPVSLDLPADQHKIVYLESTPAVTLGWASQAGAAAYHLQVASDEAFVNRVVDQRLAETTFSYPGLEKGSYRWRVTALDADHVEGHWSETRLLHVTSPEVQILQPAADGVINQETLMVIGEAAMEAKVYLNGEAVTLDDTGRFQAEIPLHFGENLIVLESVDPTGASRFAQRSIRRES